MTHSLALLPPEALRYLEHVRVEKRLAARTVTLYTLDLEKLARFAAQVDVPLLRLQTAHIRRFVALMHGGGRGGRGLALILLGWRGFFCWGGGPGPGGRPPGGGACARRARPSPCPRHWAWTTRCAWPNSVTMVPTPGWRRATPPWSSCCMAAACVWASWWAWTQRPAPTPSAWAGAGSTCRPPRPMCWARAASAAACPWARPRCRRCRPG